MTDSTNSGRLETDLLLNSRRVLVVDDEVLVRMLIAEELRAAGYGVITAQRKRSLYSGAE